MNSKIVTYSPKPYKLPFTARLINRIFDDYAHRPLNPESLIQKAKKRSGMSEFGSDFWRDPFFRLIEDMNQNLSFHALGAKIIREKFIGNLQNRLWANYWIQENPSILSNAFPPTLMITGLQRTGSTFLHRLIGELPEFRGLASWELINPVPLNKRGKDYFKSLAKFGHMAMNYLNPEFKVIHQIKYDALEEEVLLMDHSFMSSVTFAVFPVPNYCRWLETIDQLPSYQDLKMWLQLLLWRIPADKYLLLKSPHHLEFLDLFNTAIPNAHTIVLHRNVEKCLPSFCSMIYSGKKNFLKSADPVEIGKKWLRKDAMMVNKFLDYRTHSQENITEVSFQSILDDPLGVVRNIYDHLGFNWTDNHEIIAKKFISSSRRRKFGTHRYDLEDFGLTKRDINTHFERYYDECGAYLIK